LPLIEYKIEINYHNFRFPFKNIKKEKIITVQIKITKSEATTIYQSNCILS